MRKRSSGVSRLGLDKWWWWAKEEWEDEYSRCERHRSGQDVSKEEAELSALLAIKRWETQEQEGK